MKRRSNTTGMKDQPAMKITDLESRWKGLYRLGGHAGIAMLAIMAVQLVVFIISPPPDTAAAFFALFELSPLLGLLSLDLLYIINNSVLILIYLALFGALYRENASAIIIALVLGLVGIAAFYASSVAFEMFSLAQLYAEASNDTLRMALEASAEVLLATYTGTSFLVYYVLNAIALLIFSVIMLRSTAFNKTTAGFGLAAGILMVVPSTVGTVGMIFSLLSLLPWAVFVVLITRRFFQAAQSLARG